MMIASIIVQLYLANKFYFNAMMLQSASFTVQSNIHLEEMLQLVK